MEIPTKAITKLAYHFIGEIINMYIPMEIKHSPRVTNGIQPLNASVLRETMVSPS